MADPYLGRDIAGQFRVIEKIGAGGMGAVYKAEQPEMRRFVAIKILHSRYLSRQDLVTRFKREARAMSHLSHPNTARVFLYGQLDDGACYFVMEYLEGKNLAQTVRREGPMDPMRAINVMIQACGALEEAHRGGIVHRDLKPENIFLTSQGGIADFPKVLDFGLAKLGEQQMRPGSLILTQEGMVFGTPEFMSPEQARGETLDGRSDIYSLGVILYELLTGKLPFDAKQPMEYIQKHIKEPPIPLAVRAPERQLPPGLEHVLMRALGKTPADRFGSAAEFANALKMVAGGTLPTGPMRALPASDSGLARSHQAAGHPAAGHQVAAHQVAGHQVAGHQVAGHQVAGHQVAGHQVAGHQVAGHQVAGQHVAGQHVAGQHGAPPHPSTLLPTASRVPWLILGLGALLALFGTCALVLALLLR